jgi:SAM-dependent methyltransferase
MPPDALRGWEQWVPAGGRALDVACGRGAVAVWLAERGLAVDAVDVSPVAVADGARLAERCGTGARVRWWCHDLDAGLPAACAGPYDVVVCQRFRAPSLYPALVELLGPRGLLVVTVLSEVGDEPGPFRAPPGELENAFGGLEVLLHTEQDGVASLLGRKLPLAPGRTGGAAGTAEHDGGDSDSRPGR